MVIHKEMDENYSSSNYNFSKKTGRSIIDRRPLFSPDGQCVIVLVENLVRVYNIQTGDCARILETETAGSKLVSVNFPENDEYNLYSCSESGCVTIWTWESGVVLREFNLQLPSKMKILTFDLLDSNECFITAVANQKHLFVASFSLKTGQLIYEYTGTIITQYGILCVSLGWCGGDRYAAICNGSKVLFIQNLIQPHLRTEINNHNRLRILSVAAHPTDSCVAITDTLGRVTIIRGNLYKYQNLSREVMHWHYLPVLACCFPKLGSYLLTGGMEKVLVKWSVGNLASRAAEKQFIPRLPGLVRHIVTNNSHIAISLTNNCIVIASAQMHVTATILESGGLSAASRALGTSLAFHRPLDSLLLGGRTGHLQLYCTSSDKLLYNIDITQMNSIPPTRDNMLPLELEVTCAAVSADGLWLVTSEYRNDGLTYPEERLKFWAAQTTDASPFTLKTCVNLSHGGCQVVDLTLNANAEFCVSAGADQKFRIWKLERGANKKASWFCLTACYYSSGIAQSLAHGILNNFKINDMDNVDRNKTPHSYMHEETADRGNDVVHKIMTMDKTASLAAEVDAGMKKDSEFDMGGVAISQDGSLVAAWFGHKLTLWDTHLCSLRTTLSHPAMRPKGLQVKFGNGDAAHYLVCTSSNCLAVWSLLSLTMKWMVQMQPSCLTADPFSNRMAVVSTTNDVFVFTPHSPSPLLARNRLVHSDAGVFKQCAFGAPSGDDVRLYMMMNDSEIYCLEPRRSAEGDLEVVSRRNLPASNFKALLAEHQLSEVKTTQLAELSHLDSDGLGKTAITEFLSAAPHMMPPISLLCVSFLQHLSGRQEPTDIEEEKEEEEVEGSSSDEEESALIPNTANVPKKTQLWTPNYEQVKEKRLKKILKDTNLDDFVTKTLFGI